MVHTTCLPTWIKPRFPEETNQGEHACYKHADQGQKVTIPPPKYKHTWYICMHVCNGNVDNLFSHCHFSAGLRWTWSLSQKALSTRQGTIWTGFRHVAHTMGNWEMPICLVACFWMTGGNWSKSTKAHGRLHTQRTHDYGWYGTFITPTLWK